jgi:multidrug efflux system outer membrane protein
VATNMVGTPCLPERADRHDRPRSSFHQGSRARRLWPGRLRAEGPGRVALRPVRPGGQLEAIKASYRQTVAAYVNQVLIAYGDVEDALTDLHAFSDEVSSLREAVSASQNYLRLAKAQCKYGLVDYLIVIDAERTLLANQLSLAQAVNLHVAASIQLVKALGGGWNPSEDPSARLR